MRLLLPSGRTPSPCGYTVISVVFALEAGPAVVTWRHASVRPALVTTITTAIQRGSTIAMVD